MKIYEILPLRKDGKHQIYKVAYEHFYKMFYIEAREREIVRNFDITKSEFKKILLESMNSANQNDDI